MIFHTSKGRRKKHLKAYTLSEPDDMSTARSQQQEEGEKRDKEWFSYNFN